MTAHQKWYWKDPEHARALQRAKYVRYPKKIKAGNAAWQAKNREYFRGLCRLNSRLWYERKGKARPEVIEMLTAMRDEFKSRRLKLVAQ